MGRVRGVVPDGGAKGSILAVWGPTGAPGRTTLAVSLAGVMAMETPGERIVIVDGDMQRGKVGCVLGAEPGYTLSSACALPAPPGDVCANGHLQRPQRNGPWLIAGLSRPEHWREIDPSQFARLLENLRSSFILMVLDLGAELPPDPRGTIHQIALQSASLTVAVCKATPGGIEDFAIQYPRLVLTVDGSGRREADPPIVTVLNHVAPEALPRYSTDLARAVGATVIAGLPHDHATVKRAEDLRRPITQTSPRTPIAVALCRLAQEIRRRYVA